MAAGLKNRRSRSDTIIERDRASYWRRTSVALTALAVRLEVKFIYSLSQTFRAALPKLRGGAKASRQGKVVRLLDGRRMEKTAICAFKTKFQRGNKTDR